MNRSSPLGVSRTSDISSPTSAPMLSRRTLNSLKAELMPSSNHLPKHSQSKQKGSSNKAIRRSRSPKELTRPKSKNLLHEKQQQFMDPVQLQQFFRSVSLNQVEERNNCSGGSFNSNYSRNGSSSRLTRSSSRNESRRTNLGDSVNYLVGAENAFIDEHGETTFSPLFLRAPVLCDPPFSPPLIQSGSFSASSSSSSCSAPYVQPQLPASASTNILLTKSCARYNHRQNRMLMQSSSFQQGDDTNGYLRHAQENGFGNSCDQQPQNILVPNHVRTLHRSASTNVLLPGGSICERRGSNGSGRQGTRRRSEKQDLSALTYSPRQFPRSESMKNILCRNYESRDGTTATTATTSPNSNFHRNQKETMSILLKTPPFVRCSLSMNNLYQLRANDKSRTSQKNCERKQRDLSSLSYSPSPFSRSASMKDMVCCHNDMSAGNRRDSDNKHSADCHLLTPRGVTIHANKDILSDSPPIIPRSASMRDALCATIDGRGRSKNYNGQRQELSSPSFDSPPQLPRSASMRDMMGCSPSQCRGKRYSDHLKDSPSISDSPPQLPRSSSMRDMIYPSHNVGKSQNQVWESALTSDIKKSPSRSASVNILLSPHKYRKEMFYSSNTFYKSSSCYGTSEWKDPSGRAPCKVHTASEKAPTFNENDDRSDIPSFIEIPTSALTSMNESISRSSDSQSEKLDLSSLTYSPSPFPRTQSMKTLLSSRSHVSITGNSIRDSIFTVKDDPAEPFVSASRDDTRKDDKNDEDYDKRNYGWTRDLSFLMDKPPQYPRSGSMNDMLQLTNENNHDDTNPSYDKSALLGHHEIPRSVSTSKLVQTTNKNIYGRAILKQ